MSTKTIAALVCGLITATSFSLAGAQTLNLSHGHKSVEQSIAATLLADIYKRAGLTPKFQPMAGSRATLAILANKMDGEVARVEGYAAKHASLVKVMPSYYHVTTTAFAKADKKIVIASKADLKKYKVGAVRNIVHVDAAIKDLSGVQFVDNADQLYQILESGRVDVVVDSGINGLVFAKKLGLDDIKPVGELAKVELFTMLNPGQKEHAAKISDVIKGLKESGELAKMAKRAEDDAVKNGIPK